ncbi:MAG TPA: hypothetical protein PK668_27510 [Myxococcota bacterium]|nr:hypothetical protein [Myxococcota bacterium]HRY97276.1 hypothetical protein [Myxococcota bacterium]
MRRLVLNDSKARRDYEVAQHFVRAYLAAREGLKELEILRSEGALQADYAEWLVSKKLGLKRSKNRVEKDVDAKGKRGLRYQVKSRIVNSLEQPTSFDFKRMGSGFDFLVAVFFDHGLEVLGIIKVPREVVKELSRPTATTFRFRWNRRTAADSRIEKLVWVEEPPSISASGRGRE